VRNVIGKAGVERDRVQEFGTAFFERSIKTTIDDRVPGRKLNAEEAKARIVVAILYGMFGKMPNFACHLSPASPEILDVLRTMNTQGLEMTHACLRASVYSVEDYEAAKQSMAALRREDMRVRTRRLHSNKLS
jgi:hypothetical protein